MIRQVQEDIILTQNFFPIKFADETRGYSVSSWKGALIKVNDVLEDHNDYLYHHLLSYLKGRPIIFDEEGEHYIPLQLWQRFISRFPVMD